MTKKKVTIYTDGACSGNPGIGGWGAILSFKGVQKEISGAEESTTNNRMEMIALIEALKTLKEPCAVDVFTDSQYMMKGATEWLIGWQKAGWRTADKKPVKNSDLWQDIARLLKIHTVHFTWVKGHAGEELNERADFLARSAISDLKEKII